MSRYSHRLLTPAKYLNISRASLLFNPTLIPNKHSRQFAKYLKKIAETPSVRNCF